MAVVSESCNANIFYDIGDGGPHSDCRHNDPYFYCLYARAHTGKHRAEVTFSASSEKEPFLYEHTVTIEWE